MRIALALSLVLFILVNVTMPPAQAVPPRANRPIFYGWVNWAKLSDFAPVQLQQSCNLLVNKHLAEAIPGFEQELSQHPNDLAAYVGLAQAKPEMRVGQLQLLERQVRQGNENASAKLKLGVLLYYQWCQQVSAVDDRTELSRAQQFIYEAWKESKLPIAAMMLDEVAPLGGTLYTAKHHNLTKGMNDELIKELGGPKVYAMYQQAKQADWTAPLPPVKSVAPANLRPLRGVIRNLRSHSTIQVSYGMMKNGQVVMKNGQAVMEPLEPLSEQQKNWSRYLTAWSDQISRVLQDE